MRRRALLVAGVLALAGCSQADALAPVSGDRLSQVRFAAIDVLLERDIEILTVPACTQTGEDVLCTGTTVREEQIVVRSTAAVPTEFTVTVGKDQLFTGAMQDVLDAAARAAS